MLTRFKTLYSPQRLLIIITLTLLLAATLFVFLPVSDFGFAGIKSDCRQIVEGATTAGSRELNCRKALVYYNEVTCTGKCAFNPTLPFDAGDALAAHYSDLVVTSQLYVRLINEDKNPVDKWYAVCFKPSAYSHVTKPGIWSYHPDQGWTQGNYFKDDMDNMCHYHLGEASFVLMGSPK
jgi:hypothetical protein